MAAPTVALNSPADAGSVTTATPDLLFTGTDADADDIRYNLNLWEFDTANDAITFDSGSSQFVRIPYTAAINPTDYVSFTGYFQRFDWTNQTQMVYMSCTESGGYSVYINQGSAANTIRWYVYANSTYNKAEFDYSGEGYKPYSTHHIAGTYDGRYVKLYVDGVLKDTVDLGNTYVIHHQFNTDVFVGAEPDGSVGPPSGDDGSYLNDATVSDFRLYNSALAVGDIEDILDGTGYTTDLIVWLKMDEGSGTDVDDSSGNGYDANTEGNPSWTGEDLYHQYVGNLEADVVSGTDAGFDRGADTDPFDSGEQVTYTVQSALKTGATVYKWKVRGIDPTGGNTYGAWATTRSFYSNVLKDLLGGGMIPFPR